MSAGEIPFADFFARCSSGLWPHAYQERAAGKLFDGRHLELWAPTGCGKTLAVLAPFLWQLVRGGPRRWDRLLYVLPLRSLVESIAAEAERVVARLEAVSVDVRVQTGERPDDPFFAEGDIVVTTYDQLLSGALEGPYGLPDKLHNINAAAVAGALVVFDEYHLMEPDQAFLTAAGHLGLFKPLCQSVWMTATATSPLRRELEEALGTARVAVSGTELRRLPAAAGVSRTIRVEDRPLSAEQILERHRERTIVLLNTVDRAGAMYDQLLELLEARGQREQVILLHARFLPDDRKKIEERVRRIFGRGSAERCILVCTQVIEAGMDLSCQVLHTEAAPMSALIQRAGRCARFPGEAGEVIVYPLPEGRLPWLPYREEDVAHALEALSGAAGRELGPATASALVEAAHAARDGALLGDGWFERQGKQLRRVFQTAVLRKTQTVSDLIREDDGQTIRVVVAPEPSRLNPYAVEGFGLRRWGLARLFESATGPVGWRWTPADDQEWVPLQGPKDLAGAFAVCLHPGVAAYSPERGLRLGEAGTFQSPPRERQERRGARYQRECWAHHARKVGEEAAKRVDQAGEILLDGLAEGPWAISPELLAAAARATGLIHDVGKLQEGWQDWAARAQRGRDSGYVHAEPLAHTDFNREDAADREREKQVDAGGRRPPHAVASAHYGAGALLALLREAEDPVAQKLLAACLAAVAAHHGARLADWEDNNLGLQPLVPDAERALRGALEPTDPELRLAPLQPRRAPRLALEDRLAPVRDDLAADGAWWPVLAYLTRTLRLADQRATSAYGKEE